MIRLFVIVDGHDIISTNITDEVAQLEAGNQQLRDLLQVSEELVRYLNEQLPPEKRMKKALENAT
ncbi:MAG: hypothetical protein ACXACD_22440 [Candidatus Thorarchaeota archaeon]